MDGPICTKQASIHVCPRARRWQGHAAAPRDCGLEENTAYRVACQWWRMRESAGKVPGLLINIGGFPIAPSLTNQTVSMYQKMTLFSTIVLVALCIYVRCTYIRGCQNGMQGPQLCTKPCHFCKLNVATSRMAFLDLNLACSTSWGYIPGHTISCPITRNTILNLFPRNFPKC